MSNIQIPRNTYLVSVKGMERLYDNGKTTCYFDQVRWVLSSYCEGDYIYNIYSNKSTFENEKKAYLNYFNTVAVNDTRF